MSNKKIIRFVRIIIPCGGASITPPIGPTLAQFGLNIGDFSQNFNDYSLDVTFFDEEFNLKVIVVVYNDKTYDFFFKEFLLLFC